MKKITIVSTVDQKKYVIETEATTMGELTAAMDAQGISYAGMTMYEGLTHAEYDPAKSESILPHDIPFKGSVTSDLVFRLTAPQKKIKSGSSYAEMKATIKEKGLADAFQRKYGKNYTQGKTKEFEEFLAENISSSVDAVKPTEDAQEEETKPAKVENFTQVKENNPISFDKDSLKNAFITLLDKLLDYDVIDKEDYAEINALLLNSKKVEEKEENLNTKCPYSDDDINDMFS